MASELTVTFAGSGDAFGSGGRFQACISVSDGSDTLLLDCGATSLAALKGANIELNAVSHIALSHLHGDHFGGLPFLILDGQFSRRESNLTVLGPLGTADRLKQAMEVQFPGSSTVQRRFDTVVSEVVAGQPYGGPGAASFTFFRVDHASGADAHAIRLNWHGKTITYSGDTAWSPGLLGAADGADLFICEAYFRDRSVPFHMSYAEVLSHLNELNCGRIVLTHMTPELLAANDIALERAHDGYSISV